MSILDILRGRPAAIDAAAGQVSDPQALVKSNPLPMDINKGELIRFVNDEYKRREEEKRPFDTQWRLNINFLEGNQYCDINPATQSIEDIPKLYWWQEREVFNHIAPNIETRLARLARMRPILKTRPGSNEPSDVRSTKVGTHLLQNIYYDQGVRSMQSTINAWSEATGTCLVKNIWNPNLGKIIGKQQYQDENGEMQEKDVREGDLESIICPPQEIFPDSCYHQDIKDCKSIIHARGFHVDDVEDSWGIKVASEDLDVMKMVRSMVGMGGLGYGLSGGYNFNSVKMKDHTLVKEYSEKPSKKYPQGRLIIVTSNELLYYGTLPYKVGDDSQPALPFTKVVCIQRTGVFWGKTVIERLIPLQRRYNALRNRKAEYLNRCSIGIWLVEKDSTDVDLLEQNGAAPGNVIEYLRGFSMPQMADNPVLPAAFETELSEILQEFSILSGVSELSRQSNAPSGVKSGVAIQLALDQDDTRLSSTAGNIEVFLIECGKQWLRLFKQYTKGYRVLRAIGKNNVVELIDWTSSDISSDDVMVEPYSAIAESPAQRRQMVFDLLETGLFKDPETGAINKTIRAKILDIIDMGNWEAIDDDDELHIAKAERENLGMKQGQFTEPASFDDHVLHIRHHNNYRLTVEYEELANQNPTIAQMFEMHINLHLMALQQEVMQKAASMAAMTPQQPPQEDAKAS